MQALASSQIVYPFLRLGSLFLLFLGLIVLPKLSDLLNNLGESSVKGFEAAINTVLNKNYSEVERVTELLEATRNKSSDVAFIINRSESVKEYPQLPLIESIKQISEYGKDIVEMLLNLKIDNILTEPYSFNY